MNKKEMIEEWQHQIYFQMKRCHNSKREHILRVREAVMALIEYGIKVDFCDRFYEEGMNNRFHAILEGAEV